MSKPCVKCKKQTMNIHGGKPVCDDCYCDDVAEEQFDENAVLHKDLPGGRAARTLRVPFSNFEKVGQFNDACDCHREKEPGMPPAEVVRMRLKLIQEEADEIADACAEEDLVEVADGLADLLYVVYGMAHTFGIDIQPVFDEVHRSNMAKVGTDGKVTKREDGKILKPPGWTPPNVYGVLKAQDFEVCEGCVKKATTQDAEGVPLCQECYDECVDQAQAVADGTSDEVAE